VIRKYIKQVLALSLGLFQFATSSVFAGFLYLPFNKFYEPVGYINSYPGHTGTDFRGSGYGTPVYAAYEGTIVAVKESENDGCDITRTQQLKWGNYVKIDHQVGSTKYRTEYWHLKQNGVVVSVGNKVKTGDLIAYISNSGLTAGFDCAARFDLPYGAYYHLHFEVKKWNGNGWIVLNPYASGFGWLWATNPPKAATQAGPAPCTYSVGQDSSRKPLFEQAYNRNGGRDVLSCPSGPTYWWKAGSNWVVRQDFSSASIIQHEGVDDTSAFVVKGGIWNYYKSHAALGAPVSDQFQNPYGHQQNNFKKGFIFLNSGGSAVPVVYGDWYWITKGADSSLNASFVDAEGGGVQLILEGLGGSGGWVSGAVVAKEVSGIEITPETMLVWEQYDKKHSLHFDLTITDSRGESHSLTYSANASNVWGIQGYVPLRNPNSSGSYPAVYDNWEIFSRNIFDDYRSEWGSDPVLVTRMTVSHYLHDSWVGDKGGTVQNILFDYEAPVTELEIVPDYPDGGNDWYISPPLVSLIATDDASGVVRTEYDFGSGWQSYNEPFLIEQEGEITLQFRSIDLAGRTEVAKTKSFQIDTFSPETSVFTIGPRHEDEDERVYISDETTVGFDAEDTTSGVSETTYSESSSVEETTEEIYDSEFMLEGEDGLHTVTYYSSDNASNQEEPQKTDFYLDSTPPVSNDNSDGQWHNEDLIIVITAQDPDAPDGTSGSGVHRLVYSGSQQGEISSDLYKVHFSDEGISELNYHAVDNVGNEESENQAQLIKIDKTPPEISGFPLISPNENSWYNNEVVIHFEAEDQEWLSGMEFVSPDLLVSQEGFNQSFSGFAVDIAGNVGATIVTGINIDKTQPESQLLQLDPYYNQLPLEIDYSFKDNLSGAERVRLYKRVSDEELWEYHGGSSRSAGEHFSVNTLDEGYWEFSSVAVDFAGNVEELPLLADTTTIYDITAPTTDPVLQGFIGLNDWYTSPVSIELLASDNLSGIDKTLYLLGGFEPASYQGKLEFSDGNYNLGFWSFDKAGNEEIQQFLDFKIDTIAPQLPISSVSGGNFMRGEEIFISLQGEEGAKLYYSVNGSDPLLYAGSFSIFANTNLLAYAFDDAGNQGGISNWFFNFSPVVSLNLSNDGLVEASITNLDSASTDNQAEISLPIEEGEVRGIQTDDSSEEDSSFYYIPILLSMIAFLFFLKKSFQFFIRQSS